MHAPPSTDCLLWESRAFEVRSRPRTLWVGTRAAPGADDIDRLVTVLLPWLSKAADDDERICLHVEDSAAGNVPPLDLPQLLNLVGKLLDHGKLLDCALLGTVVQVRRLDDAAAFAKDVFLGLYTPCRDFDVVDSAAKASAFLSRVGAA